MKRGIKIPAPILLLIAGMLIGFAASMTGLHPESVAAQKQRSPNTWTEEHDGAPYLGVTVHYVLPAGFKNGGHPRAALVTRAGYDHKAADLKVSLSPEDVEPGEPTTLDLKQARYDCCGDFNTWHWPPDPRNFRTSGQ
jgi:hypothetical protein